MSDYLSSNQKIRFSFGFINNCKPDSERLGASAPMNLTDLYVCYLHTHTHARRHAAGTVLHYCIMGNGSSPASVQAAICQSEAERLNFHHGCQGHRRCLV